MQAALDRIKDRELTLEEQCEEWVLNCDPPKVTLAGAVDRTGLSGRFVPNRAFGAAQACPSRYSR